MLAEAHVRLLELRTRLPSTKNAVVLLRIHVQGLLAAGRGAAAARSSTRRGDPGGPGLMSAVQRVLLLVLEVLHVLHVLMVLWVLLLLLLLVRLLLGHLHPRRPVGTRSANNAYGFSSVRIQSAGEQ